MEALRLGRVDVEALRLGRVDVEVLQLGRIDLEALRLATDDDWRSTQRRSTRSLSPIISTRTLGHWWWLWPMAATILTTRFHSVFFGGSHSFGRAT